jgi:hypothetical protein
MSSYNSFTLPKSRGALQYLQVPPSHIWNCDESGVQAGRSGGATVLAKVGSKFILDGHNSHVTLEVVQVAMNKGLDIVTLPAHTSHALQPLDVSCFKPFKTAFRQVRDAWTLGNEGKKVEKRDLCEWTARSLEKALTPKNIKSGFRKTGIWPLDQQAVNNKLLPSEGFKQGGVEENLEEEDSSSGDSGSEDVDRNSSKLSLTLAATCRASKPHSGGGQECRRGGESQSSDVAPCMNNRVPVSIFFL